MDMLLVSSISIAGGMFGFVIAVLSFLRHSRCNKNKNIIWECGIFFGLIFGTFALSLGVTVLLGVVVW